MGIWAYAKKIWPSGVSPKRASEMQLRDLDLRSVGHSIQKLWQKNKQKKPCIYLMMPKKNRQHLDFLTSYRHNSKGNW